MRLAQRKEMEMVDVLAGTSYVLRPDYDATVAEFGEPPLGYPDECKFAWPETSEEELTALAAELVKVKAQFEDTKAKVTRDRHGRFTKKADSE